MNAVIFPGLDANGEPQLSTMGTRVMLAPDIQLRGITRIELLAEVDGLWRATIECDVRLQPIKARVQLRLPRPARYYRRGGRAVGKLHAHRYA